MSDLNDRVQHATNPEHVTDLALADKSYRWLEARRTYIANSLPAHMNSDAFVMSVLQVMPTLRGCNLETIQMSILKAAHFGLMPDGVECAILPFGSTATFVPMVNGIVSTMYRSGLVASVRWGMIRDQDAWSYTPTERPPRDFVHSPRVDLTDEERGPVILAYAFAWLRNGDRSQVVMLNRSDAEYIRDNFSRAYRKAETSWEGREPKRNSTWHLHFDRMWEKSCVRRLAKYVPTSPEVLGLLGHDEIREPGMVAQPIPVPPEDEGVIDVDLDDEADGGP